MQGQRVCSGNSSSLPLPEWGTGTRFREAKPVCSASACLVQDWFLWGVCAHTCVVVVCLCGRGWGVISGA